MFKRQLIAALLWASLGLPAMMARAEPPDRIRGAADNETNVTEILQQADAATKAVKAVTYEGRFYGVGAMKDRVPRVEGTLRVKPGKRSLMGAVLGVAGTNKLIRFEGTVAEPGSTEELPLKIATDGKNVYRVDEKEKVFIEGEMPGAMSLLRPASALYMQEYLYPTPFSDELEGKEVRYEGEKNILGVECDVVFVVYQNGSESRWYFGKKDHLPRRVDRIIKSTTGDRGGKDSRSNGGEDASVIEIKSLDTAPSFEPGEFRLTPPKGYATKKFEPDEEEEAPLLAVGSKAPDWELSTPDGKTVSLKSLRGNVVVMDFWATWCAPCKMAMPGVQKLHEQFKDQPVRIFAVSTWERGGDPAEYMKNKKYTYGLLLKGDKVADAYKVSSIPTFYVIGPDGKILYASAGFQENKEAEIARIIKDHTKERAPP